MTNNTREGMCDSDLSGFEMIKGGLCDYPDSRSSTSGFDITTPAGRGLCESGSCSSGFSTVSLDYQHYVSHVLYKQLIYFYAASVLFYMQQPIL